MKIRINYDLMDKIRESKTGISLIKMRKDVFKYTALFCPLDIAFFSNNLSVLFKVLFLRFGMNVVFFSLIEKYLFYGYNQNKALNDLKYLAQILNSNYINTDYELLQNAYVYDMFYKVILDANKIPRLKQEKYIMVPVVDRDGKKEVSLIQERLTGSKEYELSYGNPSKRKVLKPIYNSL